MSRMSDIAIEVEEIQMVLDSEAVFQQEILPRLFSEDEELDRVMLRREVKAYINRLLRQNYNIYEYLDDILMNGTNDEQRLITEELAQHWEQKYDEGCYS